MRFSSLTDRVKGGAADAWDQHYFAKQASERGEDVIILSVGDPDFATPQAVIDKALQAMQQACTSGKVAGIGSPRASVEANFLLKTLVADLLNIEDPHDLNQDGDHRFAFPFWTIEGLVVLNATTLGIVNDNNYPLGQARDNSGTQPDNNEFILIEVDPLWD